MIPHLFYYQLLVLGLLWLFVMLSLAWPSPSGSQEPKPATPITSRRTRGKEPKPFAGLTYKPPCPLCAQHAISPTPPSSLPPAPMHPPTRRPRGKRNKKVAVSVAMICSPIRETLEGARHHGLRVAHHR